MKTFTAEICVLAYIKPVSIEAENVKDAIIKLKKIYSAKFPEYKVKVRDVREMV